MSEYCQICGVYNGPIDPPCDCPHGARLSLLAAAVDRLKSEIKQRQDVVDECQAAIRAAMLSPGVREAGRWLVSWSSTPRTQVDSKRLKKEKPEIWQAYATTNDVHTIRVALIKSEAIKPEEGAYDDIPF